MKIPLRALATSALCLVLGACVSGVQVTPSPQLTYQLRYPVSETVELTNFLSGFLAAALILVVTVFVGRLRGREGEPVRTSVREM